MERGKIIKVKIVESTFQVSIIFRLKEIADEQ
jgi:hypothetical protein